MEEKALRTRALKSAVIAMKAFAKQDNAQSREYLRRCRIALKYIVAGRYAVALKWIDLARVEGFQDYMLDEE